MENNEIITVEVQASMDIDKIGFYECLKNNFDIYQEENEDPIYTIKLLIYNYLFNSLEDNEISLDVANIVNYEQIENKMLNWAINYLLTKK